MDDTRIPASQGEGFINIREDADVQHWAQHFGVTPRQLLDAVNKVGLGEKALQDYLHAHAA